MGINYIIIKKGFDALFKISLHFKLSFVTLSPTDSQKMAGEQKKWWMTCSDCSEIQFSQAC